MSINNQSLSHLLSLVELLLKSNSKYACLENWGGLEHNGFSITFWINFSGNNGISSVYVKIPKIIYGDKNKGFNYPLSQDDFTLAKNEYESLLLLSNSWSSEFGITFIHPLGYINEYNAIVTERFFGDFFFKEFQKYDFKEKIFIKVDNPIYFAMQNFGQSLNTFHQKSISEAIFQTNEVLEKIQKYIIFLQKFNVSNYDLELILEALNEFSGTEYKTSIVKNIKGIDVRQILFNEKFEYCVMDPGKITKNFIEVDLARFIVTCRILYWGTFGILLKLKPNRRYEENFMNGYKSSVSFSQDALKIMIIKELFKHWKMAHISLERREWPKLFKLLLRKLYVDSFYKHLISNELQKLSK
jgi:hypothetical protein